MKKMATKYSIIDVWIDLSNIDRSDTDLATIKNQLKKIRTKIEHSNLWRDEQW